MAVDSSLLSRDFAQSRKMGTGADFKIYTGSMKTAGIIPIPEADASKPIVQMRGSSTVMDVHGDIMALSALEDMTHLDPEFLIFLDHSYGIDNLFGKLYGQPVIQMQSRIADLWLAAEAVLDHPPAERAYNLIVKSKLRLGCSIGCMVLDWESADPSDPNSPIILKRIEPIEFSIVTLPANQRCWVENAIKGRFARSLVEGDGDTARRLAAAFKSLFSRDYSSVVDNITSDGLRKDLTRVKSRNAPSTRIMYTFDGEEGFYLDQGTGTKKSLTRDDVASLLEQSATIRKAQEDEGEKTASLAMETALEGDALDTTKAATGKTSWPLMSLDTEWTGSKAESQIFAWARNDDDEIVASKAKQCFLYCDPDNSDKQSGYKMPFTYIVDGSPKIVPLGCRACAGVLNGGMGGGSFSGDEAGMKAKVKTMYGRINSEFGPDPKWVVPWEKDEKHLAEIEGQKALGFDIVEVDGTYYVKNADDTLTPWVSKSDGILDTQTGGALIRQDIVEDGEEDEVKTNKAGGVTVSADGSHEKWTGTHSHSHKAYGSQGGDDMHDHEHSHDNDAHHGHSHAEKSAAPETQKTQSEQRANEGLPLVDASLQKAAAEPDETESAPALDTSPSGREDATISPVEGAQPVVKGESVQTPPAELDAVTAASLHLYNEIGKSLGLPVVTAAMFATKCNLVSSDSDAQAVISQLSQLDECTDALLLLAPRIDGYVDTMMRLMGVPDLDSDSSEVAQSGGYGSMYSLTAPLVTKEGKEINAKNQQRLQVVHDMVAAMHPDCCKGVSGDGTAHQGNGTTVEEAQEQARQMGEGPDYGMLASASADTLKSAILKAFEGVSAKVVIEQEVNRAVDVAMGEARNRVELAVKDANEALAAIAKLKSMPLGNPIRLSRQVERRESAVSIDNVASFEEMLAAGQVPETLSEVQAQTRIVEKSVYAEGRMVPMRYRQWDRGVGGTVGKGLRPALTDNQKIWMSTSEWAAYDAGESVAVPMVDDPFDTER